ncbi:extracellular solute-binding protein [Rathayibacter sp. VKM Ac-2856]|uniref:ABC transporter substrate-binding protein n=1 Tax=unclassified Rathayibacter TaxID=2609250 RepID=UPI001564200D|nr:MULTISPECIES: extracellular solute-binding protein [unclassified Rathayibacter]NQX06332.1 extracellular solute-binding protein [Rathayibacter sp. VKM Ac-2858]NQX21499.1 extracellular solute-binding protein [Rathayibacter sp. VKM Ac-2856]
MTKFRFPAAVGLAAAAALVLAGCSGAGSEGDASVEASDSGEVTWWGWTPDTPVAERYIAAFNEEYPDIEVTYKNFENVDFRTTITPALDSGKGPDVFDLSPAGGSPDLWGPYAIDLAPVAEAALGSGWESELGDGYVEQLTDSEGRLVSLPLGGMAAGFLWYNQDLLTQAGAEVPTDYDSWVDTCAKVTALGKTCFTMGAGGEDTFPSEMYHAIANSVDPDFFIEAATGQAKWDDPQGIETLQIIKDMKDDGIIAADALDGTQYPLANEQFMKGDAAMVQMGFWYTQYSGAESCKAAREAAGVSDPTCFVQLPAQFPDVAGKGNGSAVFGEADYGLAINADSPNIGAAKTFVSWMTMSEAGQQNVANALDLLPALRGVAPDWSSIALVDQSVQQAAIESLIAESSAADQSRQWQTSETTLDAVVLAIQQILDPTIDKSVEEIAAEMQAGSEATSIGLD